MAYQRAKNTYNYNNNLRVKLRHLDTVVRSESCVYVYACMKQKHRTRLENVDWRTSEKKRKMLRKFLFKMMKDGMMRIWSKK